MRAGGEKPRSWIGAFQAAIDQVSSNRRKPVMYPAARGPLKSRRFLRRQRRPGGRAAASSSPRRHLYARLSRCRLRTAWSHLPEFFQAISWRVVRDFYHKYTVTSTRCSRFAISNGWTTQRPSTGSDSKAFSATWSPELLVLSLLFHDVGKWRDDDHATESVRMAEGVLERLQATDEHARRCSSSSSSICGCRSRRFVATPRTRNGAPVRDSRSDAKSG